MLRNEIEYRHAKRQLEDLQAEIEKRSLAVERDAPENSRAVVDALEMKIDDIKREIADYEDLKNGRVLEFQARDLDDLGEMVTKWRIARGWSQADLAEALGTHQQQIQRYERNDWQKINLWRLQEVVEVLRVRLNIFAQLEDETEDYAERPSASWPTTATSVLRHHTIARHHLGKDLISHNKPITVKATIAVGGDSDVLEDQPATGSAPKVAEPVIAAS
jgi:ribosome-binding protein aMBF1 (putative translation factor)